MDEKKNVWMVSLPPNETLVCSFKMLWKLENLLFFGSFGEIYSVSNTNERVVVKAVI